MPLNPQAQAMIDLMAGNEPDPSRLSIDEMRAMPIAALTHEPPVGTVENRTLSLNGAAIPVRIYTPNTNGPHALMVYFHGGGFVLCGLDTHDSTCRTLCNGTGAVVVSVDYRLAPEHKYPAAAEDCYAATLWAAEHASELGADAQRMVVAGDSAGGNLAAVVALMARDRLGSDNAPLNICYQVLIYPATDCNFETASYRDNAEGYFLSASVMRWFWEQYLPDESAAAQSYACPLKADLAGLPPALVITAEYDPLRDEGEAYAQQLLAAGVRTELIRYSGQIHGFVGMADAIDDGARALATIADKTRQAVE